MDTHPNDIALTWQYNVFASLLILYYSRKEFVPYGSKFFPLRVGPISKPISKISPSLKLKNDGKILQV